MAANSIKKALEESQLKIAEYGVAEAKARKEKAEVELETARIQQEYFRQMAEKEAAMAERMKKGAHRS